MRRGALALGAVLAAVLLCVTPAAADVTPTDSGTTVDVDNAELRWGVNNESNNAAYAPGTYNFFSAGTVPDPGKGGTTIPSSSWSATSGDVTIEKWDGTTYRRATWAGLKTDASGAPLAGPTSGRFSDHQVVIDHGTGTVDAAHGDATVTWNGSFTVLYYSGMSFFYVSDPVLTVDDGVGTLTATLSGYASSQTDTSVWTAISPRTVTLADLGNVDLTAGKGFTVTPAYAGVTVDGVGQVRTGSAWGSFPASFVEFQQLTGIAAYWYSSGAATDANKVPLPLTVSYDAADAVAPTAPPKPPTRAIVDNPVVHPPAAKSATTTTATAPAPPERVPTPEPATTFQQLAAPVTTASVPRALAAGALTAARSDHAGALWWWLGGAFLTLAGISLGAASAVSARRPR